MEPYIVDLLCKPADKASLLKGCHISSCSIAATPEEAEAMSINLAMSHSYIVETVVGVVLKSALPQDDNNELDEMLHQKALQRDPPCALILHAYNDTLSSAQSYSLGIPSTDETNN